jgi:FHA domain
VRPARAGQSTAGGGDGAATAAHIAAGRAGGRGMSDVAPFSPRSVRATRGSMGLHDTRTGEVVRPPAARARAPAAALVVVHSADASAKGTRHDVGGDDVTIGRDPASTVVVASDQASRRHARIFASGGAHVLVDLESTNGTFLNSRPVAEHTLRHGDVIRIASTVLKYVVDADPPARGPT